MANSLKDPLKLNAPAGTRGTLRDKPASFINFGDDKRVRTTSASGGVTSAQIGNTDVTFVNLGRAIANVTTGVPKT